MGVTNALKPDGQSKYEIVFDNLQKRVGLLRMWNDYAFTRFLGENDKLITTHFNKSNQEFIGYICENDIPCIKRVEFDGIPSDPDSEYNKVYQVGEVDNLYFSEPSLKLGLKATPSSITAGEDISIQATVKSLVPYDIDDIEVKVDYTYSISEEEKTAEISFGKYKIPSLKTVPFEAVINTKDWSSQDLRINAILYSPLGYEIAKVTNIIDVRGTEIDSQIRNSIIHSIIILLHNVRGNPLPK